MKKLHIVQHLFCNRNWEGLTEEHYRSLRGREIHVSIIGSSANLLRLERMANGFDIRLKTRLFSDPNTYEHEAMMWAQEIAREDPEGYLLYFHGKGSGNTSKKHHAWNHYMSHHLLYSLQVSLNRLQESGLDATGVLYTERKRDPNMDGKPSRFFAGNFWIAKKTYLNTLPDYKELLKQYPNRYLSERFIGQSNPSVYFIDQNKPYSYKGLFGVLRKINGLKSGGW